VGAYPDSVASLQALRLSAAARLFTILALAGSALLEGESGSLFAVLALALIWVNGVLTEWRPRLALFPVGPVAEAALIGTICGFAVGEEFKPGAEDPSTTLLLALAIPPFVAAIHRGMRVMAQAVATQVIAVVIAALLWGQSFGSDQGFDVFTWSVAGVGLGLIGVYLHVSLQSEPDPIVPYLDAQRLIRELINLSEDLSSGLDVNALGGEIISAVNDEIPASALGLYVARGETLMPVDTRSAEDPEDLERCESLAIEAWARNKTIIDKATFAFPLADIAVVAGVLSEESGVSDQELTEKIVAVATDLRTSAVQLDTALMFSEFRDYATSGERRRLAREMHDGVAQDIASLGYLVDALAARPSSPEQAATLAMLRDRITKVVAEVRQSVLSLRTSIGESESLGAAIGSIARGLSETSGIAIQVTVDEHTGRLRPEVEAELFRITQEAMNNAIKHSQASAIDVHCQVYAPAARITISDNGRGMQQARTDSHGLKIMRERARLIRAELAISSNPTGGLTVSVQVGSDSSAAPTDPPPEVSRLSHG
jgi:signal transduction histidine kinase